MMKFDFEPLTGAWLSLCPRCDQMRFTLINGLTHDVRCFGWRTALYNVAFRIGVAFGIVEPECEEWE